METAAAEQAKTLKDVEREVIVRAFHVSGRSVSSVAKELADPSISTTPGWQAE